MCIKLAAGMSAASVSKTLPTQSTSQNSLAHLVLQVLIAIHRDVSALEDMVEALEAMQNQSVRKENGAWSAVRHQFASTKEDCEAICQQVDIVCNSIQLLPDHEKLSVKQTMGKYLGSIEAEMKRLRKLIDRKNEVESSVSSRKHLHDDRVATNTSIDKAIAKLKEMLAIMEKNGIRDEKHHGNKGLANDTASSSYQLSAGSSQQAAVAVPRFQNSSGTMPDKNTWAVHQMLAEGTWSNVHIFESLGAEARRDLQPSPEFLMTECLKETNVLRKFGASFEEFSKSGYPEAMDVKKIFLLEWFKHYFGIQGNPIPHFTNIRWTIGGTSMEGGFWFIRCKSVENFIMLCRPGFDSDATGTRVSLECMVPASGGPESRAAHMRCALCQKQILGACVAARGKAGQKKKCSL